jgi:hypothetical protein
MAREIIILYILSCFKKKYKALIYLFVVLISNKNEA